MFISIHNEIRSILNITDYLISFDERVVLHCVDAIIRPKSFRGVVWRRCVPSSEEQTVRQLATACPCPREALSI